MKRICWLLCVVVLACGCNKPGGTTGSEDPDHSHFDVQLKINPAEQYIEVSGILDYPAMEDSLDHLSFYLHKDLQITSFSVNGQGSYQLDTSASNIRWLPDAIKVICPLEKPGKRGEVYRVQFSYQGKITGWPPWSGNAIGPDWVEMGIYFPWYPSIGEQLFTYRVCVETDPEYHVFAIGEHSSEAGKECFETEYPVNDFIICAAKDLRVREVEFLGHPFRIVNCTMSDTVVDLMQSDMEAFYSSYTDWFGETGIRDMNLVISKREKGGGYSRIGGLFLGGLSDRKYLDERLDYIRYLAHETAHFWWYEAEMNWEDWLNESFAEYSALLIIRELYSRDEFESRMAVKQEESKTTPPVWGMARNDPQATRVLYSKGVVLLYELEQKMGRDKFLELCRLRVAEKVNNTSGFLDLLTDASGKETADWFEQALKNR